MSSEASIEDYLKRRVKSAGGMTFKLKFVGVRGAPDRVVIMKGRVSFVELKKMGGVLTGQQKFFASLLHTKIIDSVGRVDEFIESF